MCGLFGGFLPALSQWDFMACAAGERAGSRLRQWRVAGAVVLWRVAKNGLRAQLIIASHTAAASGALRKAATRALREVVQQNARLTVVGRVAVMRGATNPP